MGLDGCGPSLAAAGEKLSIDRREPLAKIADQAVQPAEVVDICIGAACVVSSFVLKLALARGEIQLELTKRACRVVMVRPVSHGLRMTD